MPPKVPCNIFYRGGLIIMNKEQKYFSISQAAKVCDVTQKQIRHWEEKGFIPELKRVHCGERSYRQFSKSDFALISSIKQHLDDGYILPVAVKKAADKIKNKEVQ
jgi:MerR family transcriptional regulator, redox-sensitive transcriptional activator SoxR